MKTSLREEDQRRALLSKVKMDLRASSEPISSTERKIYLDSARSMSGREKYSNK